MRGFGEAVSGRWKEAAPFIERFVKYNPNSAGGYRLLSMIYAHSGRIKESQVMFDRGFENWPPARKNLRVYMTILPLKDLQAADRIADGFLKAGLPGEPHGFYKITEDNRLNGEDLRELFFGRKVTGFNLGAEKQWWVERDEEGVASIRDGDNTDTGNSWIEEDMICDKWDHLYEGLKDCWVVYRNPEGTPMEKDEYLGAPGYGIYPFSLVE